MEEAVEQMDMEFAADQTAFGGDVIAALELSPLCEEEEEPPQFEELLRGSGTFFDHYTGEELGREETVAGIKNELD